jgi:cell division protein FtsI/penicillin-binding protein 2
MLKKTYRLRLLLLAALTVFVFFTIIVRLYYLQVVSYQRYAIRAQHQQNKNVLLTPRRGDIVDRNGLVMATSYVTQTIILDSRKLPENYTVDPALVRELARILLQPEEVIRKYFNTPRRHTLLRKADQEVSDAITLIADRYHLQDALLQENTSKRYYPNGSLHPHRRHRRQHRPGGARAQV